VRSVLDEQQLTMVTLVQTKFNTPCPRGPTHNKKARVLGPAHSDCFHLSFGLLSLNNTSSVPTSTRLRPTIWKLSEVFNSRPNVLSVNLSVMYIRPNDYSTTWPMTSDKSPEHNERSLGGNEIRYFCHVYIFYYWP